MAHARTPATPRSPSSPDSISPGAKTTENLQLLVSYLRGRQKEGDLEHVFASIEEYDELLRRYDAGRLRTARVLEVGFGTRPLRMRALMRAGVDATGVDMEVPVLDGTRAEYLSSLRVNGIERTVKSLIRRRIFDAREMRRFDAMAGQRGWAGAEDRRRLGVGDAADLNLPRGSLDLIVSEDVFEHVGRPSLARLLERMRGWLRPDGLALVRPNVFTGITGGHLVEWNRWSLDGPEPRRRSEPWEHLRRRRLEPNSYLNELSRRDYRELFSAAFEILEERVRIPDLGREHLVGDAARDLAGMADDELFSNQVLFVLRPRSHVG